MPGVDHFFAADWITFIALRPNRDQLERSGVPMGFMDELGDQLWNDQEGQLSRARANDERPSDDDGGAKPRCQLMPPASGDILRRRQLNLFNTNGKLPCWPLLGCLDLILGTNYQVMACQPLSDKAKEIMKKEKEKTGNEGDCEEARTAVSNLRVRGTAGALKFLKKNNHPAKVQETYAALYFAIKAKQLKDRRRKRDRKNGFGQPEVSPRQLIRWILKEHPEWKLHPDLIRWARKRGEGEEFFIADDEVDLSSDDLSKGKMRQEIIRALAEKIQRQRGPLRPSDLKRLGIVQYCWNMLAPDLAQSTLDSDLRLAAIDDSPGLKKANP